MLYYNVLLRMIFKTIRRVFFMFLSAKSVAKRYDVSRDTVYRWTREGKLPKPVDIEGAKRWRLSDLEQKEPKENAKKN